MALTVVEYSDLPVNKKLEVKNQIILTEKNPNEFFWQPDVPNQPYMLRPIEDACQYIEIILVRMELFSIRYFQHQVIFGCQR